MAALTVYGLGGVVAVGPPPLKVQGVPTGNGLLGQEAYDFSTSPPTQYFYNGQSWVQGGNAAGSFTSLTVNGSSVLTGGTVINASGAANTTIGTGGTGQVFLGNTTGGTAVSGTMTVTTAGVAQDAIQLVGGGILFATSTTTAGASPLVCNNRTGQVTFSGVSIAAGATQTFVITNSKITGAATLIHYAMYGVTAGGALTIVSVTNSGGSSSIVVCNGTGATTTTANITFVFQVLN